MNDYAVLYRMTLSSHHAPTGRTQHHRDGLPLPSPAALEIVKYPDDPGYYLLYLDTGGSEMTDTYHDSIGEAMAQAEWEFGVTTAEWVGAAES